MKTFERQLLINPGTQGHKAIELLSQLAPELSKQQLKQAMHKGAVWLKPAGRKSQKRLRRVTHILKSGDTLSLYYDEQLLQKAVEPATLIADEKHYSVWHKPAGMLAQGTLYGDHCSLMHFAEQHFKPYRPTFLIHRLDTAANGLMIIAHSDKAAAQLSKLFQERKITKRYQIEVEGLLEKPAGTASLRIDSPLDGKEAITTIENIEHFDQRSRLQVLIETGRKHQIRRHLAEMGHPVIGDFLYGSSFTKEPLQLCASELTFDCPLILQAKHYQLHTS